MWYNYVCPPLIIRRHAYDYNVLHVFSLEKVK